MDKERKYEIEKMILHFEAKIKLCELRIKQLKEELKEGESVDN